MPGWAPTRLRVFEDHGEEARKERAEIVRSVPGCGAHRFGEADRFGLLDDDVVPRHGAAPFERSEVGLDAAQAGLLGRHVLLNLGPARPQHPAQLLDGKIVVEQRANLLQRETEVAQGEQAVEAAQRGDVVEPVAGLRVDLAGLEQAGLVVMPEHAGRDLAEPCEFTDIHDRPITRASHGVKVKSFSRNSVPDVSSAVISL